jgi:hypothetical protein
MAQQNSLTEDPSETVRRLDDFLPFKEELLGRLADELSRLGCRMVLCDIAPLGIAAARKAALPSVLIESFTWDWIYEGYATGEPVFFRHIDYLQKMFRSADHRIQAEPVCRRDAAFIAVDPVSRNFRTDRLSTRKALGIGDDTKAVIITMGGIPWEFTFLEALKERRDVIFVIPGASQRREQRGNLILLPHHSDFFHPDLINACDATIGKVGYSTVAEVFQAGIPFGYVTRPAFRESGVLADYVKEKMSGMAISGDHFQKGQWLSLLPDLLALPKLNRPSAGGALQAAEFIRRLF